MKFAVYSTTWNHWSELGNLIDRFPCLFDYNFRTVKTTQFNPLQQKNEKIEVGYIDVNDLEELIELMEDTDWDLIISKNDFGTPVIEIYDSARE